MLMSNPDDLHTQDVDGSEADIYEGIRKRPIAWVVETEKIEDEEASKDREEVQDADHDDESDEIPPATQPYDEEEEEEDCVESPSKKQHIRTAAGRNDCVDAYYDCTRDPRQTCTLITWVQKGDDLFVAVVPDLDITKSDRMILRTAHGYYLSADFKGRESLEEDEQSHYDAWLTVRENLSGNGKWGQAKRYPDCGETATDLRVSNFYFTGNHNDGLDGIITTSTVK